MAEPTFRRGEKVFAKVRGHPPWPARVKKIVANIRSKPKYKVIFYGTSETATCKGDDLFLYTENKEKYARPLKREKFKAALIEIEKSLGNKNPVLPAPTTPVSTPRRKTKGTPKATPQRKATRRKSGHEKPVVDEAKRKHELSPKRPKKRACSLSAFESPAESLTTDSGSFVDETENNEPENESPDSITESSNMSAVTNGKGTPSTTQQTALLSSNFPSPVQVPSSFLESSLDDTKISVDSNVLNENRLVSDQTPSVKSNDIQHSSIMIINSDIENNFAGVGSDSVLNPVHNGDAKNNSIGSLKSEIHMPIARMPEIDDEDHRKSIDSSVTATVIKLELENEEASLLSSQAHLLQSEERVVVKKELHPDGAGNQVFQEVSGQSIQCQQLPVSLPSDTSAFKIKQEFIPLEEQFISADSLQESGFSESSTSVSQALPSTNHTVSSALSNADISKSPSGNTSLSSYFSSATDNIKKEPIIIMNSDNENNFAGFGSDSVLNPVHNGVAKNNSIGSSKSGIQMPMAGMPEIDDEDHRKSIDSSVTATVIKLELENEEASLLSSQAHLLQSEEHVVVKKELHPDGAGNQVFQEVSVQSIQCQQLPVSLPSDTSAFKIKQEFIPLEEQFISADSLQESGFSESSTSVSQALPSTNHTVSSAVSNADISKSPSGNTSLSSYFSPATDNIKKEPIIIMNSDNENNFAGFGSDSVLNPVHNGVAKNNSIGSSKSGIQMPMAGMPEIDDEDHRKSIDSSVTATVLKLELENEEASLLSSQAHLLQSEEHVVVKKELHPDGAGNQVFQEVSGQSIQCQQLPVSLPSDTSAFKIKQEFIPLEEQFISADSLQESGFSESSTSVSQALPSTNHTVSSALSNADISKSPSGNTSLSSYFSPATDNIKKEPIIIMNSDNENNFAGFGSDSVLNPVHNGVAKNNSIGSSKSGIQMPMAGMPEIDDEDHRKSIDSSVTATVIKLELENEEASLLSSQAHLLQSEEHVVVKKELHPDGAGNQVFQEVSGQSIQCQQLPVSLPSDTSAFKIKQEFIPLEEQFISADSLQESGFSESSTSVSQALPSTNHTVSSALSNADISKSPSGNTSLSSYFSPATDNIKKEPIIIMNSDNENNFAGFGSDSVLNPVHNGVAKNNSIGSSKSGIQMPMAGMPEIDDEDHRKSIDSSVTATVIKLELENEEASLLSSQAHLLQSEEHVVVKKELHPDGAGNQVFQEVSGQSIQCQQLPVSLPSDTSAFKIKQEFIPLQEQFISADSLQESGFSESSTSVSQALPSTNHTVSSALNAELSKSPSGNTFLNSYFSLAIDNIKKEPEDYSNSSEKFIKSPGSGRQMKNLNSSNCLPSVGMQQRTPSIANSSPPLQSVSTAVSKITPLSVSQSSQIISLSPHSSCSTQTTICGVASSVQQSGILPSQQTSLSRQSPNHHHPTRHTHPTPNPHSSPYIGPPPGQPALHAHHSHHSLIHQPHPFAAYSNPSSYLCPITQPGPVPPPHHSNPSPLSLPTPPTSVHSHRPSHDQGKAETRNTTTVLEGSSSSLSSSHHSSHSSSVTKRCKITTTDDSNGRGYLDRHHNQELTSTHHRSYHHSSNNHRKKTLGFIKRKMRQ